MKTMHVTHLAHKYTPKNKLDQAVQDFLGNCNGLAVEGKDLNRLKQYIIDSINQLNKQHPRCTAKKPYWWQFGSFNDKLCSCGNQFFIYHGKQFDASTPIISDPGDEHESVRKGVQHG